MASVAPSWPGIRLVKTCTECKQAKLKCDSKAKYPNPCSRCQARQLRCTVDPMFKRTPARKRLEAMSKELQELRQKQGAEGSTRPALSSTERSTSRDNSRTPDPQSREAAGDDFEFDLEEVQLDGVVLKKELAINIFKIFATYYHPQLPIIGRISMSGIFQTCPLLFWAIVAVVSFRMSGPPYQNLFRRLKQPFYDYLNREALISPLPLQKIQAVLCVCHWTLGAEQQTRDPSWLFCGIAMNASFYMGLNHPKRPGYFRGDESVSGNTDTRVNTWLSCFYVCNSLAMHLGLAPLISQPSELRMIKSLFRDYHGPREFLTQVKVQQLITSFSSMLWPNNNGLLIDVSLVQTIDEKLDEILDEQKSELSTYNTESADFTDFTILTAKLHMYAAIVTRAPGDSTSRSIILKMGLGAALRIIDLAQSIVPKPAAMVSGAGDEGSQNSTAPHPELSREECQRALSKKHFLAIVFAVVFLLRYFSLNSAAPADERQRAANHVLAARGLFRSWSLDPRDEHARAAVLFETLCRQAPSPARADADANDDPQQKPRPTDRMGVSILFDAINTAQELRKVSVEPSEEGQATWPTEGPHDVAAAASSSNDKNSDDLPARIVEKGKGIATGGEEKEAAISREEAATSRVDVPAFHFESDMDVTTGGQEGYEGGFPPHFWDNPMWDVFNFDFEAAASGEYAGDHFL